MRQHGYRLVLRSVIVGAKGHPTAHRSMRTVCWTPLWNQNQQGVGLEHLLLSEHAADSVVLAFDDLYGPFRLAYRLTWNEAWQLRDAELGVATERFTRSLSLRTDGQGHWQGGDGSA